VPGIRPPLNFAIPGVVFSLWPIAGSPERCHIAVDLPIHRGRKSLTAALDMAESLQR